MTMIEKVARNIRRQFNIRNFDRNDDTRWEHDIDEARAAIEAMREPSDEMARAVGSEWGPALENNYQRMIDAALAHDL